LVWRGKQTQRFKCPIQGLTTRAQRTPRPRHKATLVIIGAGPLAWIVSHYIMRISLLFALMLLGQGCQYDPQAHLYTTAKPQIPDVVGRYILMSQTITRDGLAAFQGRACVVDLRTDGTFTATNVPPWEMGAPATNFFSTLLTGSGTWRIDSVGGVDDGSRPIKTCWGIYLDSQTGKMMPVGLTGQKPPYGLIFTMGDPDSGDAMILERAK
jgi:hypothetical protein